MSFTVTEEIAAYALGYFYGRAKGEEQEMPLDDWLKQIYRQGYDAGITDYCFIGHPDEYEYDLDVE